MHQLQANKKQHIENCLKFEFKTTLARNVILNKLSSSVSFNSLFEQINSCKIFTKSKKHPSQKKFLFFFISENDR